MRIPFRPLPGSAGATPRPVVDVELDGLPDTGLACLLDTGSLHNRFAGWIAEAIGIDLSSVESESIGVGGRPMIARTVPLRIHLGAFKWEAPVSFCDPWSWDFNLLGQEGFFRYFRVTFEVANRVLQIVPQR